MASNNYNNEYNYPYQQSSAQQYPTAPTLNNASHQPHHYQPAPSAATTQSTAYMSYPAQSYSTQGNSYGTTQDDSWNGNAYGATRETTSRAAEVLHNMSNTAYAPNSTSTANQPGFTATNASKTHPGYPTGTAHSPQVQTQQTHSTQPSHGRPHSVNTNRSQAATSRGLSLSAAKAGHPLQRANSIYNQQQQRSASPIQSQYSHTTVSASSDRNAGVNAATSQRYTGYNHRQLPDIEASRTNPSTTVSSSHGHADAQTVTLPPASIPSIAYAPNVPEPYDGQSTTTVDPMALYDPWPEYQRKQEALRAHKAIEDAARAKEEKIAEERRKIEEQEREEERRRHEEEEEARQVQAVASQSTLRKEAQNQQSNVIEASSAATVPSNDPNELEAQIRAMMAKMRELNRKDPALLARIWEEERKAKAPTKSPTDQTKLTPQPVTAHSAQPVPVAAPQIANQRKKATSRQSAAVSVVKPATPIPAQPVIARPQSQANTRSGNTLWPPERKKSLADAAATYLGWLNPNNFPDAPQILSILDGNPSYIELCEQLEQRGLKLDRAAFAKTLLNAVPDVNSVSRGPAPQPALQANEGKKAPVPAAIMKKDLVAASPHHTLAAASPAPRTSYPPFPDNTSTVDLPTPVAEMVPIRANLKPPANKEEAARKRNLSDLVDLTLLPDDEDMGPPSKRINMNTTSPEPRYSPSCHTVGMNEHSAVNNFPTATVPSHQGPATHVIQLSQNDLRNTSVVQPIDKTKALRRNTYNPATIARDVLLACGRYPGERQLNQHLEILKQHIPQITNDSDLSTIKWDIIDPGSPPPGYFVSSVQALTKDADDEDEKDEDRQALSQSMSHAMGGERGALARVQALPQSTNPFTKQKRRGRPPRQSLPAPTVSTTPTRPSDPATMSASAPRASSIGYSAFRAAVAYGEDGKPLPKKKGRPVGWRKAIHGSAALQAQQSANGHTDHHSPQPSGLRNVRIDTESNPIRIDSRSPSVANRNPQYQSYKCKWENCSAELHNLETLKKHIYKVHRKVTLHDSLECSWDGCGREVTSHDPKTNMVIKRNTPLAFSDEEVWREHIERAHLDPLSWQLGDGPASGLSDAHDSDSYLSDAQGRRVTPRIEVDPKRFIASNMPAPSSAPVPRGRGRPPKNVQEQEARDFQNRLVSQKKRMGGPGMDRGGATLVNDKRRKGFSDNNEVEEELVDAED